MPVWLLNILWFILEKLGFAAINKATGFEKRRESEAAIDAQTKAAAEALKNATTEEENDKADADILRHL